jgi:hypothetical protein
VLVGLIQGYVIQRVLTGRVDRDVYLAGIGSLMCGYGARDAHEAS